MRVVASRIQGITVEIGGDTTKLSTALSKVNKEIRDTQAQLKDVNKLLKLDPGNAELMAQKQRLLAQAVGETREKLEALRLAGQLSILFLPGRLGMVSGIGSALASLGRLRGAGGW